MSTPAIIYLVLTGIGLLLSAHEHGKPRTTENFWSKAIATTVVIGLLWWGGLFN